MSIKILRFIFWSSLTPYALALDCVRTDFDIRNFSDALIVVADVVTVGRTKKQVANLLIDKGCNSDSSLCDSKKFDFDDFYQRYALIEPNYRVKVKKSLKGQIKKGAVLDLPEHAYPALHIDTSYLLFLYKTESSVKGEYYVNPCFVSGLGRKSLPDFYYFNQSAEEIIDEIKDSQ
ncbi:hypothetical protein FKG94_28000 [Exilibacterium tricleocarpae]|uniref:Uncharacterized protein n=1 Tax=Exilibacterium tricleocarpae TaxID=2591008 RepID=A0A545SLG8_9GAMM|nr:hypothetical protein [Exilibacterium tricleocarpae]TQV65830.1 hypothetical protein FKG94_28000 [Exilibacterium tricleocarpae]